MTSEPENLGMLIQRSPLPASAGMDAMEARLVIVQEVPSKAEVRFYATHGEIRKLLTSEAALSILREHLPQKSIGELSEIELMIEVSELRAEIEGPIYEAAQISKIWSDPDPIRALHDHHVTKTRALISRRDDLARHKVVDRLLAVRVADPADPATTAYLSDDELAAWLKRTGLERVTLEGTYLRLILDELRERRDAEAMFVDADLQLQSLADCAKCADDTHDTDDEHRAILKRWRIARSALCALARIHRGYLNSFNVPVGDDPR